MLEAGIPGQRSEAARTELPCRKSSNPQPSIFSVSASLLSFTSQWAGSGAAAQRHPPRHHRNRLYHPVTHQSPKAHQNAPSITGRDKPGSMPRNPKDPRFLKPKAAGPSCLTPTQPPLLPSAITASSPASPEPYYHTSKTTARARSPMPKPAPKRRHQAAGSTPPRACSSRP